MMKPLAIGTAMLAAFQPAEGVILPGQVPPPANTSIGAMLQWFMVGGGSIVITAVGSKLLYDVIPKIIKLNRGAWVAADEGTDHAKLQTALGQILSMKDENARLTGELATYMALTKSKSETITDLQKQIDSEIARNKAMHDRLDEANNRNFLLQHDLVSLTQTVAANNGKIMDRTNTMATPIPVKIDPQSEPIAVHETQPSGGPA